jgi:hypothetical protein
MSKRREPKSGGSHTLGALFLDLLAGQGKGKPYEKGEG